MAGGAFAEGAGPPLQWIVWRLARTSGRPDSRYASTGNIGTLYGFYEWKRAAAGAADLGWLLLRQRTLSGGDAAWVRGLLGVQAAFMLPIGAGLFLFPLAVAPIWPWALTALTGRAIGAWLVSIGVIAAHAAYENDWERLRPFTVSYTLLAVMQLLALLRFGGEIDWSAPGGWVYVLFLLSIGLVGLTGLRRLR